MASSQWADQDSISLSHILRILNARKVLVFTLLIIVVLTAALYTAFLPRWYLSTATIKVEKPEGQISLFQSNAQSYYDPYFTQEQLEILLSKKILYKVLEQKELNLLPRLSDAYADGAELSLNDGYHLLKNLMLDVETAKQGTALIDINVWAKEDPQLAADIANALAILYSRDRVAFAVSGQTEGIERLQGELSTQQKSVTEQRDTVERLREELGISGIDLNMDMLAQEIENLRTLERNLIELRVQAIGRQSRWGNFKKIPEEQRLSLVNSELITDSNIQNLLQAFMVAEQQHSRLKSQLGDAHPELVSSQENLDTIEGQLKALLVGYEKTLEIAYLESQAQLSQLEEELSEARIDQILSAQSKMRPFEEAVEKLREEEQIYQTLKLTLRQREIDFQSPKKSIEILNPAEPARRPGRPSMALNLLMAFVGGLTLGCGVAFLIEYLDTSFRTVEDLERVTGLPLVGVVGKGTSILTKDSFQLPLSEPYRVIQTNLDLMPKGKEIKTLALQSAGPEEGKSTTLRNLGSVMAMAGLKVLIIDGDLRRPTQHQIAGKDKSPGLVELLSGRLSVDEVISGTDIPNLDLITSGKGHFTLNILQAQRIQELLKKLEQRYDRILIDSPPVIGVSDASVLASLVDGVVMVVQHRRNPQSMIVRAKEIIEKSEGNLLGLILNQVPNSGSSDYNYYTANYSYYGSQGSVEQTTTKGVSEAEERGEGFKIVE